MISFPDIATTSSFHRLSNFYAKANTMDRLIPTINLFLGVLADTVRLYVTPP